MLLKLLNLNLINAILLENPHENIALYFMYYYRNIFISMERT